MALKIGNNNEYLYAKRDYFSKISMKINRNFKLKDRLNFEIKCSSL